MGTIWMPDAIEFVGPKYKAILAAVRCDVSNGTLEAGAKLPPVRDLAWKLGVTPGTIARAYQEGINEGLLQAVVGRGTFVANTSSFASDVEKSKPTKPAKQTHFNLRLSNTTNVGQANAIKRAMIKVAEQTANDMVTYPEGDKPHPIYESLCEWMEYSNVFAKPENLVLTSGGQNALSLVSSVLLKDGAQNIAMDGLIYPGIRRAVQLHGGNLFGVATDAHGIIPSALEALCRKKKIAVMFTSANVLNPTTGEMPTERRVELAAIARKYDLQLIEDDCWGISPMKNPSFAQICPERAWYISSFSKSVAAGLRFGYLLCPPEQRRKAYRVMQVSSYGMSRLVTDVAHELLINGDAIAIRKAVLAKVTRRVEASVNALGKWDISWQRTVPFIWLRLPAGWRASTFIAACERENILVRGADEFTLPDIPNQNAVRLSLTTIVDMETHLKVLDKINLLLENPPVSMGS